MKPKKRKTYKDVELKPPRGKVKATVTTDIKRMVKEVFPKADVKEIKPKKELPKGMKPWQPGQSGNPNGRPRKWVSAVAKVYGYKKSEVLSCIIALLSMTPVELNEVLDSDDATALERIIARTLVFAEINGDIKSLEVILSRAFGAPKQTVDVNDDDRPKSIDYSKLSDMALREIANSITIKK